MFKDRSILIKRLILFFISVSVLTLGFYRNEWAAVGKKWFYDWKDYQDFMVIGRLVETRQHGVFSYSGFIGIGDGDSWLDAGNGLMEHQVEVYLNNGSFEKYASYDTEPAAYGVVFGLIDGFTNFSPGVNLKLFRGIVSILTATALACFITWVGIEFNFFAAGLTLLFAMFSEWFGLFGGSIYWNIWAYYLPFLATLFYFSGTSAFQNYSFKKIFLFTFISVFITRLMRGFMFETTALIMLTVPVVYFAIKDGWDRAGFIERFLQVSFSALAGTFSALLVLIVQITFVEGSLGAAFAHIQDTLMKRSIANPDQFSGIMADSLRASRLEVINTYLQGRAINLNGFFNTNIPWLEVPYLSIFIFFAASTLLFFFREYAIERAFLKNKKSLALIASTWFSALAPLSWFILFKAHSYIHTQVNFLLWQLPFTLFGFALCGYILSNLFQRNPVTGKTTA
jgi:hypothetical protein